MQAKYQKRPLTKDFDTHGFGALILLEKRMGNCKEENEFLTYMLRSVGIPSGIDNLMQNPEYTFRNHYWSYVRTIEGHSHQPNKLIHCQSVVYNSIPFSPSFFRTGSVFLLLLPFINQ